MPKPNKETTIRVKLQARALFELGKYTLEEICEAVKKSGGSLSRQTLAKWINEDANDIWKISHLGENRMYDAEKIVQKEKILRNFKKEEHKIKDDIITKQAIKDATNEAIILLNLEKERNKLTKETLENVYAVNKYVMDLMNKGSTAKLVEEDIISLGGQKTGEKKITKTVEAHKISEVAKLGELLIKQLYGLGLLENTRQRNSDNNANNQQSERSDLKDINEDESIIVQKIEEDSKNDNFANLCRVISH